MKKVFALLLALTMVLSLAACGAKEEPAPEKEETKTETPAPEAKPEVKKVTMKLAGTTAAKPELGEYQAMLKFEELVEKYSDGSIDVEVYPANQLGTTTEFIEGTSLGTIEGCVAGPDTVAFLDPTQYVFFMPFLFQSEEHQRAIFETDNEVNDIISASLIEKADLRAVGYLYRGFRVMANTARPIVSSADLKGLSVRSPESAANVATIDALGGMPVTITWSEVFTSMQQGVCDGVENAITELYSINMQDVVDYVSETNHLPGLVMIYINETWFNSLDPSQQEAITKAGEETTAFRAALLEEERANAYKAFEDAGIEVLYNDDLDTASFREACKDVYKDFLDQFDESLYIAIRDFKY